MASTRPRCEPDPEARALLALAARAARQRTWARILVALEAVTDQERDAFDAAERRAMVLQWGRDDS